jgi:hypothetical protein
MMEVRLGTNRFVDCDRVIEIDGRSLFTLAKRADGSLALSVELMSPPARQEIRIEDNKVVSGSAQIDSTGRDLDLRLADHRLLAIRPTNDTVEVALDLRPVGLAIYSDGTALHFGASVFSGNTFRAKTGIQISIGPK